jgi:AraC-like DNA-binding protein
MKRLRSHSDHAAEEGHPSKNSAAKVNDVTDFDIPPCGILVFESQHAPGCVGETHELYAEFYLVVNGQAQWAVGGRRYSLGPGTLCHFPAGQKHYGNADVNKSLLGYVVRYRPGLLLPSINAKLSAFGMVPLDSAMLNAGKVYTVKSIFQEMLFEQEAAQEGWEAQLQSRLSDLAVRALRRLRRRGQSDLPIFEPGNDRADLVARYALRLKSQFFRHETMAEAARSVGVSRRHFTLLFRKVTGQSWLQYILQLRLRHVAKLLTETDKSVLSAAVEAGFSDLSHFHHTFKAAYGCSPLAYRERWRVRMPKKILVVPDAQSANGSVKNFQFRGIKGWLWTAEQYLEEIPTLVDLKMNFLMNCPGTVLASEPGAEWRNEWWKPMTKAMKCAYASIIHECQKQSIIFCHSLHPQLASPRPLEPRSAKDIEAFYQHFAWSQEEGVQWFSICLDGTNWDPAGPEVGGMVHAGLVNKLLHRLRTNNPNARFALCPLACWGDGTNPEHRAYLEALAREMDPEVYVFWNGDSIVSPRITRLAAESFKNIVKHRMFLWDNYPVNDNNPTLHLGPLRGRESDLHEVIEGYISNPLCSQNQINRIPLATCADYALNPQKYDPGRSIGQAILRLAKNKMQEQTLKDLVEAYPGFIVTGGATGTNPVRAKLGNILARPDYQSDTLNLIERIEDITSRLAKYFPQRFSATRKTLEDDVTWMKQQLSRMV